MGVTTMIYIIGIFVSCCNVYFHLVGKIFLWTSISLNWIFLWMLWWLTNLAVGHILMWGIFVWCRTLRVKVVFNCWSKVGMCCRQTLKRLSMMPVSGPFFKVFGIMIPLNIRIFNWLWHYLNGFRIPLECSIFWVLMRWC